jgi:cytochrome c556
MRPSNSLGALVAVTTLLVAGCTTAQPKSPAEVVEERQKLMKQNGDSWKNIQDNAKTGNWAVVAANAEIISKNAAKIPSLFPEGSLTDKSKAKPEIWQKWPEFESTAKKMETEAGRLQSTAAAGNGQGSQDIIKDFGRNACGACHTPFRVPPPRQG